MAVPKEPPLSVEAYLALDRASPDTRYEYLDGVVRAMSGGTLAHARIALNLARAIEDRLNQRCMVYNSDARVQLAQRRYVYPDVTVTCDPEDMVMSKELIRSPRVVVEVLSPSTETYDRGRKALAYRANPTLEAYLLVDAATPTVEVFARQGGVWTVQTYEGLAATADVPPLGIALPLAAIYARVSFEEPDSAPE